MSVSVCACPRDVMLTSSFRPINDEQIHRAASPLCAHVSVSVPGTCMHVSAFRLAQHVGPHVARHVVATLFNSVHHVTHNAARDGGVLTQQLATAAA